MNIKAIINLKIIYIPTFALVLGYITGYLRGVFECDSQLWRRPIESCMDEHIFILGPRLILPYIVILFLLSGKIPKIIQIVIAFALVLIWLWFWQDLLPSFLSD